MKKILSRSAVLCLLLLLVVYPYRSAGGASSPGALDNGGLSQPGEIPAASCLHSYEVSPDQVFIHNPLSLYDDNASHERCMGRHIVAAAGHPPALPEPGSVEAGTTSRNAVGVIIPLSGKWDSVGQRILKGIMTAGASLQADLRRMLSTSSGTMAIMKALSRRSSTNSTGHKVVAIIGPVGEQAVETACREAQARHLPAILFTQAQIPPGRAPTVTGTSYC
jgi:hypothetical protein